MKILSKIKNYLVLFWAWLGKSTINESKVEKIKQAKKELADVKNAIDNLINEIRTAIELQKSNPTNAEQAEKISEILTAINQLVKESKELKALLPKKTKS
jgi:cell shape-determining protein MreC